MNRSSFAALVLVLFLAGCAEEESPMEEPRIAMSNPPPPAPVEKVVEIGRSVEDRPIVMHIFGSGPHPVLVLGGIHGSEKNSADCAALLVEHLRAHPMDVAIAVIPAANPDGLARGVRVNAHRVDLNRNFPSNNWALSHYKGPYFGGPSAGSEPETQVFVTTLNSLQPSRILSIHSIVGNPCNNYDGPGEPLAKLMTKLNGYPTKDTIGYPTPGSLGAWAGIDRKIPMVTLELPHSIPGTQGWEHNQEAILAFIRGTGQ